MSEFQKIKKTLLKEYDLKVSNSILIDLIKEYNNYEMPIKDRMSEINSDKNYFNHFYKFVRKQIKPTMVQLIIRKIKKWFK
jgi:hypothetical protein